jgi:outer membrane protein assembly factor BamB
MRRTVGLVALAGALVMGGCWPSPGQDLSRHAHNPFENGFDVDSVAGFVEKWSVHTDEIGGLGRGVGPPVVADGKVLVTSTRSVYAFDAATGAQRWAQSPLLGSQFTSIDTDGFVYNGSYYVGLFQRAAPSSSTGIWVPGLFDLDDGSLFASQIGGRPEAIRDDGGPVALLSRFSGPFPNQPGTQTAVVVPNLNVEVTQQPGKARLTLGTTRLFHAGVGTGTAPANGVRSYPLNGAPGWTTSIDGTVATSPVLSANEATVYVGTDAGTLYALATADGTIQWSAPLGTAITAAPALANGTLYVPTASGSLFALADNGCSAATCEPLWSTPDGAPLGVQPAVAAGVVFTGADDGTLQAFDAHECEAPTCQALWSVTTDNRITGAPAVSLGTLYITTADGRVVAYGLP